MRQGELEYLNWIRKQLKYSPSVIVGSGDDAAVIRRNKKQLLLATCDTIVEGIDFKLPPATAREIGYKSLAVSLSDLAAMGGVNGPIYALIAVVLRPNLSDRFARQLFMGMKTLADKFKVEIIGGDVSATKGPLSINTTLLGITQELKPLRRSGACVGDAIMVTGHLGGSILGKHLSFTPRLAEAALFNRLYRIHSMIDISDGLLIDLSHILEMSGVGTVLYEIRLPISQSARYLAQRDHKSALEHAFSDGEDFELLFTLPPKEASRLMQEHKLKIPVSIIGTITKERGIYLQGFDDKIHPLKPSGYEHFRSWSKR